MIGIEFSLTKRLVGWGLIMALIVLGLAGFCMYQVSLLQRYSDTSYRNATVPLKAAAQFVLAFATVRSQITNHVATSETEKMNQIEAQIKATLKEAEGFLSQLGASNNEQIKKEWQGIVKLINDAVSQSRGFRKFEALNAINSGEGLQRILALNKRVAQLLTEAVGRAEDYQKNSETLGKRARKYVIIASIGAIILSVLIGLLLARSIGGPLRVLSGVATKISEGDLGVEVPIAGRKDEIGVLGEAFKKMVTSLKNQISMMIEVVAALSSVAGELSSTMSQLLQNASRTSTAVTEVTTTMAEVSQAAKVASAKAVNVVETSQQALATSDSGRDATQKTIDRIGVIRDQMKSIGETVVKLSEQSQAIEEIIVSVQDLADQSHLLAVNASIEAARAGDQGKGFAVVANEIKSLADQSKEATDQIRSILDDTRKWVSAVVMAAEQGSKAVDSGVEQSVIAGDAIKSLVDSVANSAQAASVISASSEEQLAGTEQASSAMVNIEQTMRENVDGTSQVETAAKKLQDLGESLNELVKYYKL